MKHPRSRLSLLLLVSGLAVLLSSCAMPPTKPAVLGPILMGVDGKTGSFSGDEENLGFRLAFKEANAAGGVHGRQLAWVGYPREGTAIEPAMANVRRMVEQDKVFALMNLGGPLAIPASQYAQEQRVPMMFPHTGLVGSEGKRYLFTSFPSYAGEARLMFSYLPQQRGLRKLGIVHDENVYGQLFVKALKDRAEVSGYTVVGNEPVRTRNPGDLRAELARLAAAGADGIVMALYPAQAKVLMNAKVQEGWQGRMISVGPLTDEEYLVLPGGAADGTLGFCYYPDPNDSPAPGVARYRAAMARFEPGHPMNRYSLYGYVFGQLVLEGLRRAGPVPDRERFIDAMETIRGWDPQGVMPTVSFSRENHHAQFAGFICELKQGKFQALSDWVVP
jgi:ABC-type branched-subunit amino acid transport system substrate-binding protein